MPAKNVTPIKPDLKPKPRRKPRKTYDPVKRGYLFYFREWAYFVLYVSVIVQLNVAVMYLLFLYVTRGLKFLHGG